MTLKIILCLGDFGLTLKAQNEDGELGQEYVTCEYSGQPLEIGLIFDQFNSVMSKVKSSNVYLYFAMPNNPVKIKEVDTESNDNACIVASCTLD